MFTNNNGNEHGNSASHNGNNGNNAGNNTSISWKSINLDFTRSGLKQFLRINSSLGDQFIRGPILFYELKCYLAAHEAIDVNGTRITVLDESCQTLRYDDRIVVILRRVQGVWYITDVYTTAPAVGYEPTYFWMHLKLGVRFVLAHVLTGWRKITGKMTVEAKEER